MESFLGSRPAVDEESLQMWDLNKRLEAYLVRVKYLEEENELLKAEIQSLSASPAESSWRGQCEAEVAALRATLDQALREKCAAELARDGLHEQVQQVRARCQQERAAQDEAKGLLALGKKDLEEERRAHLWLRQQAGQLQQEVEALAQAHRDELAGLERELDAFSRSLAGSGRRALAAPPAALQPLEVEDYAQRLASLWQGAVDTYKGEVAQLEASLRQASESLWKATEGNRQSQLRLQQLESELAGLRMRKEALEESLAQQEQQRQGEAQKLQLAIESLEEEKQSLRVQIAQVLEDRQQLMHLKMSLSLEVATYRTLLEAESTRLQMPTTDFKLSSGFRDVKLEASNSKLQAVSLDRGRLGSRDLRPSPITFLKGNTKPRSLKNQTESFTVNLASKSRSPVSREFQKANTVLQSQSTKSFDVALPRKDVPAFINVDAFKLGSSQQNKAMMATKIEMISQSFFHESPPKFSSISPIVPDISGESDSNTKQRYQKEGEGIDGTATKMETGQTEEKGELYEEVEEEEEEEEKQPSDEPPGKTTIQNVPYSSQLVTEALEMAIKEANGGDIHPESSLLNVAETQNDIHSDNSLSMEEENEAASLPNTGVLEGATQKVHKDQMGDGQPTDQLEDIKGFEDCIEVNGGHEVCVEQQEQEAEVWVHKDQMGDGQPTDQLEDIKGFEDCIEVNGGHEVYAEQQKQEAEVSVSCDAEPSSPLETGLPKEERNRKEILDDLPVTGEMESYKETRSPEQNEGDDDKQPRTFQSMGQSDDSENVSECTESVSQLDKDAPAIVRGEKESWEPGTSHCDEHAGATGGYLEEMDGGVEDLEVISTEALHLSEDEERRELWSPSRENEEYDLQADMLGSELLQTERGFAIENLSPISHTTLLTENCQEHLFLQVDHEKLEEQGILLYKTDSALLEEEGKETVLESETYSVEETISLDENLARDKENTLADEPGVMKIGGAEEEDGGEVGEDIFRHKGLHKEDNDLGNEDTMEKEGFLDLETVSSQEGTREPDIVLQYENVENVLGEEISKGEQTQGTGEACQAQVLMQQRTDDEMIIMAPPEADGDILKGEDLIRGTEATETMGTLEMEGITGHISTNILQDEDDPQQCPEAKQFRTDAHQAEEQQVIAKKEEESLQSQDTTQLGQSPVQNISKELEAPSEAQSGTTNEAEAKDHTDISYHQLPSDYSGSEESLESLDTSPNATCERDGIEKVLESGKPITLEETLPDHTPLHMYDGQMVPVTGNSQPLPESQEAAEMPLLTKDSSVSLQDTQQVFEEDDSSSPLAKENDNEQEHIKVERDCNTEAAPNQDPPKSEEPPTSKYLEETKTENSEHIRDPEELHTMVPERSTEEESFAQYPVQLDAEPDEQPRETFQQGNDVEKEPEFIEQIQEEEAGIDSAWESEKDNVFQVDQFNPSNTEEGVLVENDGPLELSDQGNIEAEGTHKVSPLTSVADLGEIILEGEVSPGGERVVAESEVLAYYEDESLPHVHESQQISDLESCGTEDHTQQKDLVEADPSSKGFQDPSPETVVSISIDSMKDSDILEIVEQALEFNQELIKAAEHHVETELTATGGDVHHSSEEKSYYASITSLDIGESQIFTEAAETSSPNAKDSTESSHLWVESNANGLQQDPNLADFTKEILNGVEHLHPSNMEYDVGTSGEELMKKVTITQQFHKEETDDLSMVETISQCPPQTPSTEEAPKAGEVSSEVNEKPFLDQKGLEALDANESIFAEIMQTACVKGGKDAELEAISIPAHFGDEVLCLESSQHLKFRLEDDEELWSSEDN